ncbi:MAG TPA: nitroreductase family protein [Planctomycetes bacterium]|nr:nitroreductase family protein [Planctomycetota bacterium]
MNVKEAIRSRRSVKCFDPEHRLSDEELHELIEAGMLAPTSFNMQNFHFVFCTDKEVQAKLRAASWNQAQVEEASVTIVLAGDLKAYENSERYLRNAPEDVRDMFGKMIPEFYGSNPTLNRDEACRSVSFAAENMMLRAKEMGLDSCPMIGFDPAKVSEILGLDGNHPPLLMLTIGKALKPARPRMGLLSIQEVVSVNKFGNHPITGELPED